MLLLMRRAVAFAAAGEVEIGLDNASAAQGASQALAKLVFLGSHLAVRAWEEQGALRRIKRLFEEGHERRRERVLDESRRGAEAR
jgi:hypothetical protein